MHKMEDVERTEVLKSVYRSGDGSGREETSDVRADKMKTDLKLNQERFVGRFSYSVSLRETL